MHAIVVRSSVSRQGGGVTVGTLLWLAFDRRVGEEEKSVGARKGVTVGFARSLIGI